jgi:hypothetical protein
MVKNGHDGRRRCGKHACECLCPWAPNRAPSWHLRAGAKTWTPNRAPSWRAGAKGSMDLCLSVPQDYVHHGGLAAAGAASETHDQRLTAVQLVRVGVKVDIVGAGRCVAPEYYHAQRDGARPLWSRAARGSRSGKVGAWRHLQAHRRRKKGRDGAGATSKEQQRHDERGRARRAQKEHLGVVARLARARNGGSLSRGPGNRLGEYRSTNWDGAAPLRTPTALSCAWACRTVSDLPRTLLTPSYRLWTNFWGPMGSYARFWWFPTLKLVAHPCQSANLWQRIAKYPFLDFRAISKSLVRF